MHKCAATPFSMGARNHAALGTEQNMTNTIELATKNLPHALRQLVKMTGKRPNTVELTFTSELASVTTSFRTVKQPLSLGKLLDNVNTSWTGSDGESNYQQTMTFSGPVVIVNNTYNRKMKHRVSIVVGGVSVEHLEAVALSRNTEKLWGLMDVIVDLAVQTAPSSAAQFLTNLKNAAQRITDVQLAVEARDTHADAMEAAGWLA